MPASLDLTKSNNAPFQTHESHQHQQADSQLSPRLSKPKVTPVRQEVSSRQVKADTTRPFADAHLSYLAPDTSDEDSTEEQIHGTRPRDIPSAGHQGGHESKTDRVELSSPQTSSPPDRSKLVGLGELATPKWASGPGSQWLSSSAHGAQDPLPSLVPFDSPTAPLRSQMPTSTSLMSLAEENTSHLSPYASRHLDSNSSSNASPNPSLQHSPAPSSSAASKSPSAAMSAIDTLLDEFKENDPDFSSDDHPVSPRTELERQQAELTSSRRYQQRQLPQLPAESPSTPGKAAQMVGLGLDVSGQASMRSRKPSGPRAPPESPSTPMQSRAAGSESTVTKQPSRPDMHRQASSHSQTSELSVRLPSPSALPSPRHPDKSPRTSVHHRRQSGGATSMRSRSSSLHPQSPAHIAHAIMRAANEEGIEVDALAGHDDDTAAALRKLDGLSGSKSRSRDSASSTAPSRRGSVVSLHKHSPSVESKTRRPRSKSGADGTKAPPPFDLGSDVPALPSPNSAVSSPRVSVSGASLKKFRPVSGGAASDHRASTSSASAITSGSQTTTTPRDSASYTSMSTSSPSTAMRPSSKSGRRNSASSEFSASGLHEHGIKATSSAMDPVTGQNLAASHAIPPVPPLPKDFEAYSQPGSAVAESFPMAAPDSLSAPLQSPSRSISFSIEGSPRAAAAEISSSSGSSPAVSVPPTRSPSKKWSISSALHMGRTPSSHSSNSGKASGSEAPRISRKSSADSNSGNSFVSSFTGKKSASSNDIATLASANKQSKSLHSSSLATIASAASSSRPSSNTRSRKDSTDSCDTNATAQQNVQQTLSNIPEHRKPEATSGIPFFARRDSATSQSSLAPSNSSPELAPRDTREKDRSGRKSILGLNFLGRKGSNKTPSDADDVASVGAGATPKSSRTSRISVRTSTSGQPKGTETEATGVRARLRNKVRASLSEGADGADISDNTVYVVLFTQGQSCGVNAFVQRQPDRIFCRKRQICQLQTDPDQSHVQSPRATSQEPTATDRWLPLGPTDIRQPVRQTAVATACALANSYSNSSQGWQWKHVAKTQSYV